MPSRPLATWPSLLELAEPRKHVSPPRKPRYSFRLNMLSRPGTSGTTKDVSDGRESMAPTPPDGPTHFFRYASARRARKARTAPTMPPMIAGTSNHCLRPDSSMVFFNSLSRSSMTPTLTLSIICSRTLSSRSWRAATSSPLVDFLAVRFASHTTLRAGFSQQRIEQLMGPYLEDVAPESEGPRLHAVFVGQLLRRKPLLGPCARVVREGQKDQRPAVRALSRLHSAVADADDDDAADRPLQNLAGPRTRGSSTRSLSMALLMIRFMAVSLVRSSRRRRPRLGVYSTRLHAGLSNELHLRFHATPRGNPPTPPAPSPPCPAVHRYSLPPASCPAGSAGFSLLDPDGGDSAGGVSAGKASRQISDHSELSASLIIHPCR